ncbi:TPA: CBU_0585 family protein, partial [Legionella pneumophila]
NKAYVSPYDKFLYEFDATHKKSASQLQEIKKHERLFKMRDDKDYKIDQSDIWEGF